MRRAPRAERAQPLEDDVDVPRVGAEVEDARRGRRRPAISASAADERREVEPLVPGPHRVPLHEPVGLVAGEARVDEREQEPLAEVEAVARRRGSRASAPRGRRAPRRATRTGRACSRRARNASGSTIRSADECEMSRSCQSATFSSPTSAWRADDAREPADPLGDDRVPLVRHRRRPLLAAAERLLDLAHLGPREVPDLEREPLERRGEQARARSAPPRGGRAAGSASSSAPARARAARRRSARPRGRPPRTCRPRRRACRRASPRARARPARGRARARTPSRRA